MEYRSRRDVEAREPDQSDCTEELTNFPERDDVQWMKHILSRLDAKHVENAKVVFEYQEVIDQLLDDQMCNVPPECKLKNSSTLQYQSFGG